MHFALSTAFYKQYFANYKKVINEKIGENICPTKGAAPNPTITAAGIMVAKEGESCAPYD